MKLTKNSKIFLAGHNGMVGSAIKRKLIEKGYKNILTKPRKELDLTNQTQTFKFLKRHKPDLVIIAAAKVGGIMFNSKFKHQFIYENIQIQSNIIHGSYLAGTKNLIFLGSSCIYPKHSKQPMKEKYLLTGKLEESNEGYAIAKIVGLKMCEYYNQFLKLNYKSLMPPNLYGPNDNFSLNNSHFYPALLRKIFNAKTKNLKTLEIWGSGKVKRELMFVEDFAEAAVFFMNKKIKEPFINVGNEKVFEINWYAKLLMKYMKTKLKIIHNRKKPDGTPIKSLDITLARKYGWKPKNNFKKGFDITYRNFLDKKKLFDK